MTLLFAPLATVCWVTASAVAGAKTRVAEAWAAVRSAKERVQRRERAVETAVGEVAQCRAEAALAKEEVALAEAIWKEAKLAGDQEEIAQARERMDTAQTTLRDAQTTHRLSQRAYEKHLVEGTVGGFFCWLLLAVLWFLSFFSCSLLSVAKASVQVWVVVVEDGQKDVLEIVCSGGVDYFCASLLKDVVKEKFRPALDRVSVRDMKVSMVRGGEALTPAEDVLELLSRGVGCSEARPLYVHVPATGSCGLGGAVG